MLQKYRAIEVWCIPPPELLFQKFIICSETTPTGKSRFHISTPLGIEPGFIMMGSKGLTHWTSETVYDCSETSGSPHVKLEENLRRA
jgi:hypothetical protein